jgi:hypothetical protein
MGKREPKKKKKNPTTEMQEKTILWHWSCSRSSLKEISPMWFLSRGRLFLSTSQGALRKEFLQGFFFSANGEGFFERVKKNLEWNFSKRFFFEVREGIFPTVFYQARDSNSDSQAIVWRLLLWQVRRERCHSSHITNNNQVLRQEFDHECRCPELWKPFIIETLEFLGPAHTGTHGLLHWIQLLEVLPY